MIEIDKVRKSFGKLEVLKGIDLTVAKGEVLTVIGGSGSGKSTLLTCINGLEPIDSGHILVDGVDVHAKSTDLNKLRRKIGIVFQQFNAFPHLTVLENVMLAPVKVLKRSKAEAEAEAVRQLNHVGLGDKLAVYPSRLSGGQQQRLAIARALLRDTPILLLDEATSALDAASERLVQDALDRLMQGRTTLVVAHRLATILSADRILVMDEGRVVEEGSHAELKARGGLYARLAALQFGLEAA